MNPAFGQTNSPQDNFLNARRKRRAALVEHVNVVLADKPTELALNLAQIEEEDAADVYNFSMQNVRQIGR